MCTSKPKMPAPVASAPRVEPVSIDDAAVEERDRERKRQRARFGRQATILVGNSAPVAGPVKTALGS